jgi:hypothetical protein
LRRWAMWRVVSLETSWCLLRRAAGAWGRAARTSSRQARMMYMLRANSHERTICCNPRKRDFECMPWSNEVRQFIEKLRKIEESLSWSRQYTLVLPPLVRMTWMVTLSHSGDHSGNERHRKQPAIGLLDNPIQIVFLFVQQGFTIFYQIFPSVSLHSHLDL